VFSNDTSIATTALVNAKILGGVVGSASAIREQQTATASQTLFTLVNTYSPGTGALWIYINGVRQFPGTFLETSPTQVTFSAPLTAGDVVLFEIGIITSGDATAASAVSFSPVSGLPTTDVQSAIASLAVGLNIVVVTGTTYTAVTRDHAILTNVAATTITLPAAPAAGAIVWITWTNSNANNVVARNGSTIMGFAEDMTLDSAPNGTVQLRFVNSSWRIL
jgi:hypothetical protein